MYKYFCLSAIILLGSCQTTDRPIMTELTESTSQQIKPPDIYGYQPPTITPYLSTKIPPVFWDSIRNGFALDHKIRNKRVKQQLRWLKKHPSYMERLKTRIELYLPYIHDEIKSRDLPSELALLPIIESALDPYAFSSGGASGLWQFMPATAERFGIRRDWWYDGRRDVVASTKAALDYLEYLHRKFNDWHLAIAAYNAGEGKVQRAIQRSSRKPSFWHLRLPRETQQYVPRLLALSAVVKQPSMYNIALPFIDLNQSFTVVNTESQIDLGIAATHLEIKLSTIYDLNPALNRWATPPKGPHHLIVPSNPDKDYQGIISAIPEKSRISWTTIEVKRGDTLSEIAADHKTSLPSLRKINSLASDTIKIGQILMVPHSTAARPNPKNQYQKKHIVKRGDSLWAIAVNNGTTVRTLAQLNKINTEDPLKIGQKLKVPAKVRTVSRTITYRVRAGDSLSKIAARFNVEINEIEQWNQINRKHYVHPGQDLTLEIDVLSIN